MLKGILSLLNTILCVCVCVFSREHLETWVKVWAWELLKENGGTEYKANQ